MKVDRTNRFKHACPKNCYSACTMISETNYNRLVHLTGDDTHPYTKGKLCSKGYAYIENNYHENRLKYPYYQEKKGTGKFKQITWNCAFDLIISNMVRIDHQYGNFLPLALYKYSGNLGVQHFAPDQFFSSLGKTSRIIGSPCSSAGFEAIKYDTGEVKMSELAQIAKSELVFIWGANPASTNIHIIPYIIEAKGRGAKVIVIDPLLTETAQLADIYIQIRPSTDGALANVLIQGLYEDNGHDKRFLDKHSYGFDNFFEWIKQIDRKAYLQECEVPIEAQNLLSNWLKNAKGVSHIIGFGFQRHSNGGQNVRTIQALAAVHGDIGREGGGVFYAHEDSSIFNNQKLDHYNQLNHHNRLLKMNDWIEKGPLFINQPPLEMLWISCRNPLTQDPNPQAIQEHLKNVPFVVTVEQFLTPTANMSNLVLPTTTHFEEFDIVTSYWHKEIAFNEKAIPPYFECRSEWNIMNELAKRLNQYRPGISSFPVHTSEEEYLDSQFNKEVFTRYGIQNISELRSKRWTANSSKIAWEDKSFPTDTGKYNFFSKEAQKNGFPATPLYIEGKTPEENYPFWLITPHHPHALNSHFHFLQLSDETEPYVGIHPKVAKELGIFNGEVVKVFNDQASIEIRALFSNQVPRDILFIYQGWYPHSNVNVNQLVPVLQTDMGEKVSGARGTAFHDTFVNVAKL